MRLPLRKSYIKSQLHKHRRSKPLTLQLPITSRCNSSCVTCNVFKQHQKIDINAQTLKTVLQNDFFSEVRTVGVNGGEFTLVPSFFDILDSLFVLPNISSVYLISNGLLPDKLLSYLQRAKILCESHDVNLHFCLSCDGVEEVHNHVRGIPNCFERTKMILDTMMKDGQTYCHSMSVGCTISRQNVEYIWQTYEFLSQYPFPTEYHLAVPNKRIGTFWDSDYYVLNDEKSRLLAAEFFYIRYLQAQSDSERFQYFSNYYFLKHKGKNRPCECEYRYRDVTVDENLNLFLCATASDVIQGLSHNSIISSTTYQAMNNEAKKLSRTCCESCGHYSYHNHTLKGRLAFVFDYVPKLYTYQLYQTLSLPFSWKRTKRLVKMKYRMFKAVGSYLRQL